MDSWIIDGATIDARTDDAEMTLDGASIEAGDAVDSDEASDADAAGCGAEVVKSTLLSDGVPNHRAIAFGSSFYFLRFEPPFTSFSIQSVPITGGKPFTILGPTTTGMWDLTTDGSNVYFTTAGYVASCPITGCGTTPTVIASLQINPTRIVTDGKNVYYTTDTKIMKCAVTGCGSTPIVFADISTETRVANVQLATDGAHLYWTHAANGVVWCPLSGCVGPPAVLSTSLGDATAITSDGKDVYWGGSRNLFKCAVGGCADKPTILATGNPDDVNQIAILGGDVVWAAGSAIFRCASTGCAKMPRRLANHPSAYTAFSIDASSLHVLVTEVTSTTATGEIRRCPACGCDGAPTLAADPGWPNRASDIATEGTSVFWVGDRAGLRTCAAANCLETATGLATTGTPTSPALARGSVYYVSDFMYFSDGHPVPLLRTGAGSVVSCAEDKPSGLISDGTYVYWVGGGTSASGWTDGAIVRVSLSDLDDRESCGSTGPVAGSDAGTTPPKTTLASGLKILMSSTAVDSKYLYFSSFEEKTISKIPIAGGARTVLATGLSNPYSLAVEGTYLYWTSDTEILRLDLSAPLSPPVSIASSETAGSSYASGNAPPPRRLTTDHGFLYWVSPTTGDVMRSELPGKPPVRIASMGPAAADDSLAGGIGVAGGRVFFSLHNTAALYSVAQ